MTEVKLPTRVGWTAFLTAYSRAQESREATARFDDPFASMFIGAVTGAQTVDAGEFPRVGPAVDDGSSPFWRAMRYYFCVRTPFYDQQVLRAVAAGCRQVVLLGAGLDSRALRLGLGEDVTVFELDQAPVLDFKQAVLDERGAVPAGTRIPVRADLRDDWPRALSWAGFDASSPAVWVAEGLLMYLTRDDADQLLAAVTARSAPGSRLAGEYFGAEWQESDAITADEQESAAWALMRQAFRYGPVGDTPADWSRLDPWSDHHHRRAGHGAGPRIRAARVRPARRTPDPAVRRLPVDRALTGRAGADPSPRRRQIHRARSSPLFKNS